VFPTYPCWVTDNKKLTVAAFTRKAAHKRAPAAAKYGEGPEIAARAGVD
jgi:hypothetical protein